MRWMVRALALMASGLFGATSMAAAADAPRTAVTVEISHSGNDVRAVYKLARPVDKLDFGYQLTAEQAEAWSIATPGLKFEEGDIVGTAPFDTVEVAIHPTDATIDIPYPSATALGQDGVLLVPQYFIPHRGRYETTLNFAAGPGEVVLGLPGDGPSWKIPPLFPKSPDSPARYVYVGPRAAVVQSGGTYVFSPGVPEWMRAAIASTMRAVIPYYERQSGRRLKAPPFAYVVHYAEEPVNRGNFRADVTDDQMVLFRFWGPKWVEAKPDEQTLLREIVAHEAFHFWNGSMFAPSEGGANPWLHEGGASYLSLLAQSDLFGLSPQARRTHLEESLNSCIEALRSSMLVGALRSYGWGSATYACGEVAQWLADVGIRKRTKGRENIHTLWQKMFDGAVRGDGTYATSDFLLQVGALGPDARAAVRMFLVEEGVERWTDLPARLAPMGIVVNQGEASMGRLRETIMWHLLRTHCSMGYYGFGPQDGAILLKTGQGCGPLSGDPAIVSVDGHNLFSATRQAYSAAWSRCRAGQTLMLGQRAGAPLAVQCRTPMLQPLPSYLITTDALR